MYLLLNGSFGIGKSTVARELRATLPSAAIFDPEWIGLALMHLSVRKVSDFQDLPRWRQLTVRGAITVGALRPTVVIPMTFSNLAYLDEVKSGLAKSGKPVFHFCLTAPIEVVQERLAGRGEAKDDPRFAWTHRRAVECGEAHRSRDFALHIPTESRTPRAIAEDIAAQLRSPPK